MDSNGTRCHMLLGYKDWAACNDGIQPLSDPWRRPATQDDDLPGALSWNSRASEVTLRRQLYQYVASPGDTPLTIDRRRGAACDRFGNWYWIDPAGRELLVLSAGSGDTTHFWSTGDGIACAGRPGYGDFAPTAPAPSVEALALRGLAVTRDHYLVVGVLDPAGLLIFDLFSGGPPRQVTWRVPFAPFDMSAAPDGGVWILDQDHCYWALDRYFRVIEDPPSGSPPPGSPDTFQPQDAAPDVERRVAQTRYPSALALAASPLDVANPVAIEGLPDGSILILDSGVTAGFPFSTVRQYRFSQPVGRVCATDGMAEKLPPDRRSAFRLVGYDFAFVPDDQFDEERHIIGRLVIAEMAGNQSFAFNVLVDTNGDLIGLEPLAEYLPMRLFGGKALVSCGTDVYYDFADRWIILTQQKRSRYDVEADLYTPDGRLGPRPAFDSGQPDCVWHRVFIDGRIPPGTAVTVYSRASNDPDDLLDTGWYAEPVPYRRGDGSEIPYAPPPATSDFGTWELLLQNARGRYLQLYLHLEGNGLATPGLRSLRVGYPRFSYLERYLPAVYGEDRASASFLERFLANIEGMHTTIEGRILNAQILFDARSAPREVLDWLASWLGLVLNPAWDDARRRLLIAYAADLYRQRGTLPGLLMALQIATDPCPDDRIFTQVEQRAKSSGIRLIEKFRTRQMPAVVLGDPTEPQGLAYIPAAARWDPKQGGVNLGQRYGRFIGTDDPIHTVFPIEAPADPAEAAAWHEFAQMQLRFVPSADPDDQPYWADFLLHRYYYIDSLNEAYQASGGTTYTAFADVPLPQSLPADGAPLFDWYQFQSVVLPMQRAKHSFTVLLPVPTSELIDPADLNLRRVSAARVIDLEKPAHTVYEVKFYWDMFRVGEARLGSDSVLGQGSRMLPVILGQSYLAENYLAPARSDLIDEGVVGRGALRA